MPNTVGGGLRDLIINDGVVSGRVWADRAPEKPTFPYVTIIDAISTAPALEGDSAILALQRLAQVDLWQRGGAEDDQAVRSVFDSLNGAKVTLTSGGRFRIRVQDTQRIFEPDTNIVHHAFTLGIKHDPSAF